MTFRVDRSSGRYAIPRDVSPLAFDAILACRRGTVVMDQRRRELGIRMSVPGLRGPFTLMYPLKPTEDWEDACRALGIL